MKQFLRILLLSCIANICYSQTHNPYFLGHSLVNFNMPAMFEDLCIDAGVSGHQQAVTVGNGANLAWQWTNPTTAQGPQYPAEMATAVHDVFVMTEAIPLKGQIQWANTYGYANNFHDLAQQYVPQCQTYMYETWHCNTSGAPAGCSGDPDGNIPWRTRLTNDLTWWERIADSVNLTTSGPPMLVIPAGQSMARLYDSVEAGAFMPTYDTITDFFLDNIHLNDIGNYVVALAMYATIYKDSPVGLTNQTYNQWGNPFTPPSVTNATKLQELVWDVVCHYPRSGVNCSGSSIANSNAKKNNFTFYPNPISSDALICKWSLDTETFVKIEVIDVAGRVAKQIMNETMKTGNHNQTVDLSSISSGIYFIKMQTGNNIITNKLIKN